MASNGNGHSSCESSAQHRLGHANLAITLRVYSHFFKHTESDAADRLAHDVLNGATEEFEKVGIQRPQVVEQIAVSTR